MALLAVLQKRYPTLKQLRVEHTRAYYVWFFEPCSLVKWNIQEPPLIACIIYINRKCNMGPKRTLLNSAFHVLFQGGNDHLAHFKVRWSAFHRVAPRKMQQNGGTANR